MAKDRSLVRASDIGAWAFCHRAWWLARVQHAEHENPTVFIQGDAAHEAHGQAVTQAGRLQRIGLWLLVAGIGLGGLLLAVRLLIG